MLVCWNLKVFAPRQWHHRCHHQQQQQRRHRSDYNTSTFFLDQTDEHKKSFKAVWATSWLNIVINWRNKGLFDFRMLLAFKLKLNFRFMFRVQFMKDWYLISHVTLDGKNNNGIMTTGLLEVGLYEKHVHTTFITKMANEIERRQ